MNHTPGPWQVEDDAPHIVIDSSHNPLTIANCGHPTSQVAQANARLISAAPELLEALKDAASYVDTMFPLDETNGPLRDAAHRYRVIIAKAEGKP